MSSKDSEPAPTYAHGFGELRWLFAAALIVLQASCTSPLESGDSSVRKRAVANLHDQARLASIATNDSDHAVALAAVERLHDPLLLKKVALTSKMPVSEAAVRQISDPDTLLAIVKADNGYISPVAVDLLNDQTLLAEILQDPRGHNQNIEYAVAKKLTDQAVLLQTAIRWHCGYDSDDSYPPENISDDPIGIVVLKLTAETDFAKVATEAKSAWVRTLAVEMIATRNLASPDQQTLARISAENEGSISFHKKHGFVECGRFRAVGQKGPKVYDMVWMQKIEGEPANRNEA